VRVKQRRNRFCKGGKSMNKKKTSEIFKYLSKKSMILITVGWREETTIKEEQIMME
jgi:hypothetical protein